jgi:nitrile hydratase accessory protein
LVPLDALPAIPRAGNEPVFREPWEARAFALAVALHEKGLFTWPEWAEALGGEIAKAGPEDDGSHYYKHWLSALEGLIVRKGVA